MNGLLYVARGIDRLSEAVGRATAWLAAVMVLIGAGNAVLRHLSRDLGWSMGGNAALEAQWYLFSLMFLLGAAWTLKENAHVRVDVLYGRLGGRGRAVVDLAGALLFLLPFCAFALYVSGPSVWNSWTVREMSQDPGGLPRYPIKAAILVCFVLVGLQGVSEAIKAAARLTGHLALPEPTAPADRPPAAGGPAEPPAEVTP